MADLTVTGEVVVNSEKAEAAFDRVGDAAQGMANEVSTSAGKAGQAVDKIGDGAGASAEKFTRAEARMRDSIRRSTQELQLLGKTASEKLEFNIQAKGLDSTKFAPYIEELKKAEAAQRIATGSLDNMGMSAKATAAAMRTVPAQFQDIIVSLQGGQAPMTVLLQQGSQLSTMFGGVGAATRALGTYVMGLVNPFTLAAAAAAALGVAMYSINGKDAALRELSVQLAGTGRASASAVGDIKALVNELNLLPGVSKTTATAIVSEFAKVSGVGAGLFKDLGSSVADFAAATGTDLPTAAKKLADAFADPAKGARTLEDALGTLTAAQILSIEKMAAIGDKAGAQAALMDALKTATSGLANDAMTPLGAATDKLSNAWDSLTTSVGNSEAFRTANSWLAKLIEQTAELTQKLSQMQPPTWLKYLPGVGPAIGSATFLGGAMSPAPVAASTPNTGGATGSWAGGESEVEKQVKAALDATKSYESQAAAMEKLRGVGNAAKDALKALEDQHKGNSLEAQTLRERIAGVNEKLEELAKKGKTSGAAGTGENEVAAILARNEERIAYLEKLRDQVSGARPLSDDVKPTQNEELAARLQKELETSIKGVARAQKEKALAAAQAGIQTDKDIVAAEKQKKSLIDLQATLEKQIDSVQRQADSIQDQAIAQENVNANLGKSKTAVEQATLAQLQLQKAEADSSGSFSTAYVAALTAKTAAQARYVKALQDSEYAQKSVGLTEAARVASEESTTLELQLSLIGKTQLEREKIIAQRRVELNLAKELAEIEKLNLGEGPEAEARRAELRAKAQANAVVEANNAANKAVLEDWQRTADSINNSLTDALLRGFESGKDFAKNLRDTVVNMFKTMVLRPVISAVLSPISGAISGMFGGGGGVAGGGSNPIGMVSNASTLYSAGTSAYGLINSGAGLAGWTGAGVGSIFGQAAGNAALGTMVTGDLASSIAAANAASAAGGGSGVLGMGGSGIGSTGMGALGAGGIFAAVAAVILNGLGAFRSDRRVASGLRGTLGSGEITPWEEWREGGTLFSGPEYTTFNPIEALTRERARLQEMFDSGADPSRIVTQQTIVDNLEGQYGGMEEAAKAQSELIQSTFTAMKESIIDMGDVLGLSTDKIKDFTTQLGGDKGINLEGLNPQEQQAKIAEALATANNDIAQQIIGTWETTTTEVTRIITENVGSAGEDAQLIYHELTDTITATTYVASEYAREGENAVATLTRLAGSLSTVNGAFELLGVTLYESSLAGGDAASTLVDAFGGLDAFSAATSSYFENYYSQAEREAAMRKEVADTLAEAGIEMPRTRAEFRETVNALLEMGEAGAEAAAVMLGVQDEFAAITEGAGSMQDAFRVTADGLQSILEEAVTNAGSAAEASRNASMAFEESIYGGLQDSLLSDLSGLLSGAINPLIDGLIGGAAASSAALAAGGAAAASSMAAGGAIGASATAQGGAAAAGAMASGGSAAAGAMVGGGAAVGGVVASVLDQARAYVNAYAQILSDPAIKDVIGQISGMVGEVAGIAYTGINSSGGGGSWQSPGGPSSPAADKANDYNEALKSIGETIESEVKRLRGLMVEDSPFSKDVLLAQFTTATAQARAGDKDALAKLPDLSKAIEAASAVTAVSAVEMARTRGWLAGSLEDTLKALGLTGAGGVTPVITPTTPTTTPATPAPQVITPIYNPAISGATMDPALLAAVKDLSQKLTALMTNDEQNHEEAQSIRLRVARSVERLEAATVLQP
jgi:hypothetical protein